MQERAAAVIAYYDRELRESDHTPADQGFLHSEIDHSEIDLDVHGWCKPGTATLHLATLVHAVGIAGLPPSETCPLPRPCFYAYTSALVPLPIVGTTEPYAILAAISRMGWGTCA